jgi:hypothetical protein
MGKQEVIKIYLNRYKPTEKFWKEKLDQRIELNRYIERIINKNENFSENGFFPKDLYSDTKDMVDYLSVNYIDLFNTIKTHLNVLCDKGFLEKSTFCFVGEEILPEKKKRTRNECKEKINNFIFKKKKLN